MMKNCLFLQGGDAFDLEAAVKRFSYDTSCRLQADDLKAAKLEELLFSPSFFAKTLVIVENGDELNERAQALIEAFVKEPRPGVSLLVQAKKALSCLQNMPIHAVQEVKPWEKQAKSEEWITSYLKERGIKASREVVATLASSGAQDRFLLQQELDKLITYSGETITQEAIKAVGTLEHEESIWELVDAFLQRDKANIASHLRRLLEQDVSPYLVIRQLRNSCHQALMMVSLVDSGAKNVQEHFPQLRGKTFEKTMRLAQEAGARHLTKQLMKIDKAELALKDSPFDEEAVVLRALL